MLDGRVLVVRLGLRLMLLSKGASVRLSTVRSSMKNTTVIRTWSHSWWAFGRVGPPQRVHQHPRSSRCFLP